MSTDASVPLAKNEDSPRGFAFALTAYLLWGFLPFYMKAVAHIPPAEVIAHRIVWSLPLAGIVLIVLGRTADISAALRSPRMLAMGALTASLITVNWGTYVWAIGAGHSLDAALGYFINPLFSIFLGAVLLQEKLQPLQIAAIALAALAVAILAFDSGGIPWVALTLAVSWGFYALLRKTLPLGPNQGFFLEVLILSGPALLYILYLEFGSGQGHLYRTGLADTTLLLGCGVVTAVPLMIYANGAKLLKLSTIGIMQYIAPTMIFLIAVFAFQEPLSTARMIAFPLIWAGLFFYSWSMLKGSRGRM
ncbi:MULTISPECIES: EamA family transporter RarD [unclassified Rhizobium]|uniref:EamA family transporter RarD n=1 Tax=unclassified Rhizobium TaxID=2613769 RepID=UPI0007EC0CFB|nr:MULTISPECIES: EamA family transporter RarD [unclassified Rhizobium]ANK85095.1 transporter protein RarD [Rhizobium sp. N731]ANL15343.1 transporter protein RarD [Rhizobium sp. N1314]